MSSLNENIILRRFIIIYVAQLDFVVMANPKSIINKDKCPSDIKPFLYKEDNE